MSEGAKNDAAAAVHRFLQAMEARDLTRAQACLGAGFSMVFPGGVEFRRLSDLVDWSRGRYARIGKDFDGTEVAGDTVWVRGTLHGDWPDGSRFDGIRFADRFEVTDGLITRQEVWNDMGEHRNAGD
ncbi:MAG: nuclear transport factor 2 family protein [Rhodobacteraceae bacterium]|nr:nuclear transport factor 2 family protein [Paracoccaceae bacterium]